MKMKTNFTVSVFPLVLSLAVLISCKDLTPKEKEADKNAQIDSFSDVSSNTSSKQDARSKVLGSGIRAAFADSITKEYYKENDIVINSNYSKSVYFSKDEIDAFFELIEEANQGGDLCPNSGALGVRLYYAKYPPEGDFSGPFPGQHTLVLRATCNGRDIRHQINQDGSEVINVAYNFGDVCPPKCDPNSNTPFPNAGKYAINGNCIDCPPIE